ncbi:MAG: hypothetical protein K2N89_07505 [Lachnospiraceae bacterium]|nr:hypothetical protein [Lachnospiraceae bacterium]
MRMKHLLIEGYCDERKTNTECPCKGTLEWGVHCIGCSDFCYTYCPHEIALSDENGVVERWIGFGGDMDPNNWDIREKYTAIWNKICKKKIREAHDEFMKRKQKVIENVSKKYEDGNIT